MATAMTTSRPNPNPSTTSDHDTAMLQQHTLNQLRGLRLDGMIAALDDTATQVAAGNCPSNNAWRCWSSASWTGATPSAWRGC